MLQLSKRVEYGLIAILHLDTVAAGKLTTTKEVAEQYHAPVELLGKVLQKLARKNTIESVHGAKGGYRLTRALEEITVGEVIEALEGPVHLARCQDEPESCDQFCVCNIREPVLRIQDQLSKFIHDIELSSFRRPELVESAKQESA